MCDFYAWMMNNTVKILHIGFETTVVAEPGNLKQYIVTQDSQFGG